MSGINELRSKHKTRGSRSSGARQAVKRCQHRKTAFSRCMTIEILLLLMFFLCQSDKERHMIIGEIYISPILFVLFDNSLQMHSHSHGVTSVRVSHRQWRPLTRPGPVLVSESNITKPDWSGHGTTRVNTYKISSNTSNSLLLLQMGF